MSHCLNCRREDFAKKVPLEINGVITTACNICSPEKFSYPLEEHSGANVVSTGALHATLDWSLDQPVVSVVREVAPLRLLQRLWRRLRKVWHRY